MIDGSGAAIYQVNRVRWSFMVKCGWDFTAGDLEALTNLAAATSETQFTFTNINGTIYKGTGKMVGDINGNGNSSTVDIKASGGGQMQIL
jgi:hypothetical protein